MDIDFETRHANAYDRVRNATHHDINARIDRTTNHGIEFYANRPDAEVRSRIAALEQEWDIERVLEVNAATLALSGLVLGMTVNKRWLALSALVLPFLLQHGLQGWCPPLPILRRMGIRTQDEIDREKYALLTMLKSRGDHDRSVPA